MTMTSSLSLRTRTLGGLATVAALALGTLGGLGAGSAAFAQGSGSPTLTVSIAPAQNGVLTPGAPLVVDLTVTNTGSMTVNGATATVALETTPLLDRAALGAWLNPTADGPFTDADDLTQSVAVDSLAAGASKNLSVTFPADVLAGQSWGVLGLDSTLSTDQAGTFSSTSRNAVVWNSGTAPAPLPVSVAMPITSQAGQTGLIPGPALATQTGIDGLLTRQLDSITSNDIALFIDPRIIASIRALGTAAPASATAWLATLESLSNPIYPLAYADADLSVQAQAGAPELMSPRSLVFDLDPANFTGLAAKTPTGTPTPSATDSPEPSSSPTPTATTSPDSAGLPTTHDLLVWDYTETTIAWPRDDTVAGDNLAFFAQNGYSSAIVSSSNVSIEKPGPSAHAQVGDTATIISDDLVSSALREASNAVTVSERNHALAELSATLAVSALEGSTSGGSIFATLDREWPAGEGALRAALTLIDSVPWGDTAAFSTVPTAGAAPTATLIDRPEDETRVSTVKKLFELEAQVAGYSSIGNDPTVIDGEFRSATLALLSNSWANNPGGWTVAVDSQAATATTVVNSVGIVEGSPVNLLGLSGEIPLLIQNNLNEAVTLTLVAAPSNARLVVGQAETITIEPNASKKALVPVEAVANGHVTVRIQLYTQSGILITPVPTFIPVFINAEWEAAGTWIVAGVVVLLLIAFVIRFILKRRAR